MRVENEVLTVLSRAATQGNALTLVGQLDRRLYDRTNKVLEAAGGKWNRKAKAHLFDGDAADAIEQIILTGEITIPQDCGWGWKLKAAEHRDESPREESAPIVIDSAPVMPALRTEIEDPQPAPVVTAGRRIKAANTNQLSLF